MRKHMAVTAIICVALFYLTACEKKAAKEEQTGYQESAFNNSEEADKDNISRLKQLVVGEDYFLVLYDDGSVWGWGNNAEGKLGAEESFVSEPQRIEGLPRVVKLEDGGNHIFALTERGDVYTWGRKWEIVRTVPVDTHGLLDAPTPLKGLSEIVNFTAKNGTLYAVNENGDLYVSMLPWEHGYFYEFYPLQDRELFGEIDCMAAGAGDYDYLIRTDGTVFSLMTVAYAGIETNAYAFIFPHIGDVTPADEDILSYHRPEGLPDITILDESAKNEFLIYYELTGVEGIDAVSSDPYTMFLSKKDGTLCYWNSDRIKYHDIEFALTNPDTLTERCNGNFVEIYMEDVLEIDSKTSDIPHIVSIQSGMENTMFLTDDGQVFISKYETYEITDVEYGLWVVSDPSRMPHVATYQDAHLKELTFEKLDLTDIESIWTNGENYFCAVDREGGYYRIKMEDNEVTQFYQGLIP